MPTRRGAPPPDPRPRLLHDAGALHQSGKLDEAARRYQVLLSIDPDHFEGLHMFGVLRAQQGALSEAAALLSRAIERNPTSAPAHNNLGMALNLAERHREAVAPLERAVALDPHNAIAWNSLGIALQGVERMAPALAAFERATVLKPDYVEALSNLGGALQSVGRYDEAMQTLERTLTLNPQFAEAHLNLGVVLHSLERRSEALSCFERTLSLDPHNLLAYAQIAGMHLETGDADEARRWYERALAIQPRNPRILYNIMQCGKVTAEHPHVARLEALARDPASLPDDQRVRLHFALGKAYADLRQDDRSFNHYVEGNTLKRSRIVYDLQQDLDLFRRVASVFSGEFVQARAAVGACSDRPVFVLGMMRSGSTLVEQILASHPAVAAGGERPDFDAAYREVRRELHLPATYPEAVPLLTDEQVRQVGERYIRRLEQAATRGAAVRITDKMPGNFSAIGFIHLALPNARIIHTVRDPIDTCLSCFSKLFAEPQPFTYDLRELGAYYRAYQQLMNHWRHVLPEGTVLEVRYEDVVADFEMQARGIVAYCGLPWNDACLAFHEHDRAIRTASQLQVRQPIYRTSVGRWRPAPELLRPLLEGLEDPAVNIERSLAT
ncbi:MAG TPA: sulfotransferase [Acetobacteraceae bacterium]|nr:sulfotransferase [Acetobacteraceae bacterium]